MSSPGRHHDGSGQAACTPAWHRHHALADAVLFMTDLATAARIALDSLAAAPGYRMGEGA